MDLPTAVFKTAAFRPLALDHWRPSTIPFLGIVMQYPSSIVLRWHRIAVRRACATPTSKERHPCPRARLPCPRCRVQTARSFPMPWCCRPASRFASAARPQNGPSPVIAPKTVASQSVLQGIHGVPVASNAVAFGEASKRSSTRPAAYGRSFRRHAPCDGDPSRWYLARRWAKRSGFSAITAAS